MVHVGPRPYLLHTIGRIQVTLIYKSDNKLGRGPVRPTLVEWPPSEAVPEREPPVGQQPFSVVTDGGYDGIDPAFEQRGRADAERIRHKAKGCTSTDSWQHTFGKRYCVTCWPCTDEVMRAQDSDV